MGIHEGHRKRLKKRFIESGLDNFADHEVLELLLFYAMPYQDTNTIAHELTERFGSLSNVMETSLEKLTEIKGVGEHTAMLIKLIPQLSRRYMISKASVGDILSTADQAGKYTVPLFVGQRDEVVYQICLDIKCKVLNCRKMFEGSVNSAQVSIRKIVETALQYNAASVIIAHNHTSGIAIPSEEDEITTQRIRAALNAVGITLADHLVVADDDFVSMAQSGFFVR